MPSCSEQKAFWPQLEHSPMCDISEAEWKGIPLMASSLPTYVPSLVPTATWRLQTRAVSCTAVPFTCTHQISTAGDNGERCHHSQSITGHHLVPGSPEEPSPAPKKPWEESDRSLPLRLASSVTQSQGSPYLPMPAESFGLLQAC